MPPALKVTVPLGADEPDVAEPATVATNSTGSPCVEVTDEVVKVSALGTAATVTDTGDEADALNEVVPL
jgi:hypothetical protein